MAYRGAHSTTVQIQNIFMMEPQMVQKLQRRYALVCAQGLRFVIFKYANQREKDKTGKVVTYSFAKKVSADYHEGMVDG